MSERIALRIMRLLWVAAIVGGFIWMGFHDAPNGGFHWLNAPVGAIIGFFGFAFVATPVLIAIVGWDRYACGSLPTDLH